MIWCSGGKLAAAVSEAGGLGLIGAGSMEPEILKHHIEKARTLTGKPFGVNLPITYKHIPGCIDVVLEENVPVVVVSAGSPKKYTSLFKQAGRIVMHVTSTPELAVKCRDAGVDAVVVEGFEAGGHNGRDEITTFCLVPQTVDLVDIPVVAAGGIADGRGMAAALALGADGVQVGTRFAASAESSAADAYKKAAVAAGSAGTRLLLKKLMPTRLLMNSFAGAVQEAEARGATEEDLKELLGRGRARAGIFEGDVDEGAIEIGQCSGLLRNIQTAEEIVYSMVDQCRNMIAALNA
jgi:enoyl-[acyl-carrier protein] reductase II